MKTKDEFSDAIETHRIWHKFSNWLIKKYGKDLYSDWQYLEFKQNGKKKKLKFRDFNDGKLNKRLVGYDVMSDIERYIKRYCPEIKIIHCDDSYHAGSTILLIPHPKMGITVMFIPQCTTIQNQFFLYDQHLKMLLKELKDMKYVYKNQD